MKCLIKIRGLPSISQRAYKIQKYRIMSVRFYLSYDTKTSFKSHFRVKKDKMLPYIGDVIMDVI